MHTSVYVGLLITGLALSSIVAFGQEKNSASFLDSYQWQKRVILVFMPIASDATGQEQLKLLRAVPAALAERDLVVMEITGEAVLVQNNRHHTGSPLRRQFKIAPGVFTLVLIGKDGGEKYRSQQLTPPARLFTIIDAMPMRQSEIKSKKNQ